MKKQISELMKLGNFSSENEAIIQAIEEFINRRKNNSSDDKKTIWKNSSIPIGISARHIHLSREHIDILFGNNYQLNHIHDLAQPGQFVCDETVTINGPKGEIENVRVLGPERKQTQVEVSKTDSFKLGIKIPVRGSGKLEGSPGIKIKGSKGQLEIKEGLICALRHIHMKAKDANELQLKDGMLVNVQISGLKELTFGDVLIRVKDSYALEMHIDTDEANAANLGHSAFGNICGIQESTNIED